MVFLTPNRAPLLEASRFGQPLTPPDTDSEYVGQSQALGSGAVGTGIELDPAAFQQAASMTEVATPQPRKVTSLSYINSGPRESREKVVHRGLRWLVVAVPPSSFAQEHGHLGHTLSSGPPSRLSDGILMPLFPTMGGQLGAIAREFNLPSTAGLCLYLQAVHSGLSMSARISDDSWHILWGNLLEPRSPGSLPSQLPIAGRIQFDIDMRKARWYDAWLSASRRDAVDVPVSVAPSRAPSVSHWRGDSRTTFLDDAADEQFDNGPWSQQLRPATGPTRHIPRKLSLVDRLESVSVRSGSKLVPRNHSPPSPTPPAVYPLHALSPIVQEEEPKSGKRQIDKMVNSWRASASLSASPFAAATGQISLDPVNMPNDMPLNDTSPVDSDVQSELNLDDFAWSVSSLGPPEYNDELESFVSWGRVPSVHLDRRAEGSVCLTPSVCTSFGPLDYDDEVYSLVSNISRLPSPDIAARFLDDVPPSPSTATSWGPPSSYPPSPLDDLYYHRAPSVDLGYRGMSSRPVTPTTATSWGPPSAWAPSPAESEYGDYRARSPDVGERGGWSRPVTPSTATSWGPASYPPSPTTPYHVATPDAGQRAFDLDGPPAIVRARALTQPWKLVWPYIAMPVVESLDEPRMSAQPWQLVWPYNAASGGQSREVPLVPSDERVSLHSKAVDGKPWAHVWPYSSMRKERSSLGIVASRSTFSSLGSYPHLNLYPAVYPFFDLYPTVAGLIGRKAPIMASVRLESSYPDFNIYPAAYPCIEIYPAVFQVANANLGTVARPAREIPVKLASTYPTFEIYPLVYPWNLVEIYRSIAVIPSTEKTTSVSLPVVYPSFDIYPSVYPHNLGEIYPSKQASKKAKSTALSPVAPLSGDAARPNGGILIKLLSQYPTFDIYPHVYPDNLSTIYPPIEDSKSSSTWSISVKLIAQYPTLEIYSPVYPSSLESIYPAVETNAGLSDHLRVRYPEFEIYSAVYPYNLDRIYPSCRSSLGSTSSPKSKLSIPPFSVVKGAISSSIVVQFPVNYPAFDLYPAVYPHNMEVIYPATLTGDESSVSGHVAVKLSAQYPAFEIYPPVYPWNLDGIYPAQQLAVTAQQGIDVQLAIYYPMFRLYPAVYPDNLNDIYSGIETREALSQLDGKVSVKLENTYPFIVIYPAAYPHNLETIYPSRMIAPEQSSLSTFGSTSSASYPVISLYPPIYPFFDLYPEILKQVPSPMDHQMLSSQPKVRYPEFDIYPAVYPHFDIYPGSWRVVQHLPHAPLPIRESPTSSSTGLQHRRPRFTHMDLHRQVFARGETLVIAPVGRKLPSTPRRPRYTHLDLHQQVFAHEESPLLAPAGRQLPSAPKTTEMNGSGSSSVSPLAPRTRTRSGTVSSRASLSIPAPDDATGRAARRLPTVPAGAPPVPPLPPMPSSPSRPLPSRATGLPVRPTSTRRPMSTVTPPLARSPNGFSPLPPVPEPGALGDVGNSRPVSISPARRPLPQLTSSAYTSEPTLLKSTSATLPSSTAVPPAGGADLSRAKSLPPRPLPRRQNSVANRAKVFDLDPAAAAGASGPVPAASRISMSQFPLPPRAPLPPVPVSRPVAKLDHSKYPFA